MLENPYYSSQPNIPTDAGAYRSEGRVEESPDGTSITVWWESTLEEGIDAQLRFQGKLGTKKQLRRAKVNLAIATFGSCVALLLGIFPGHLLADIQQGLLFIGCAGVYVFGLGFFRVRPQFKRSVRELIVNLRGIAGSIEMQAKVDARGIHESYSGMELTVFWRNVGEIAVTPRQVTFYRDPPAIVEIPTRVFPDALALEKFVALAQKYQKQRAE